ncbi:MULTISPECIES: hypothetical protein [Brevibacillus]|uniref:Fibronectin type-III domain-containing protein n=1 Tax=Brevibacillus parabrevis TaxID=54914 RepID=A0A4Y3PJS5_BREPA|nr:MULTISPECIES: hypothetical protein [Brevibacillus]UED67395.1 hypothetical protein HP435_19115 [Brevibacillus sp. HD3.3A]WDV93659.1 hypothetical protein PSE45_18620 [Brevibacillus parabrevis]GEB34752.1 hypothetical protein BPA01_43320 [Brevibacillus parabrevis]
MCDESRSHGVGPGRPGNSLSVTIEQTALSAEQVQFRWRWSDSDYADYMVAYVNGQEYRVFNYGETYGFGAIKTLRADTSYDITLHFYKNNVNIAQGELHIVTPHDDTIAPNVNAMLGNHTSTTADFEVWSDEPGTIYYIFVRDADFNVMPNKSLIMAGNDPRIVRSGQLNVTADQRKQVLLDGFTITEPGYWTLYLVSEDSAGNISSIQGAGFSL